MKLEVVQLTKWSPTQLSDYEQCPLFTQLKYGHSLCGRCFKGRIPWEGACTVCDVKPVKPAPMQRGIDLGGRLERYVNGTDKKLDGAEFDRVRDLAKKLRVAYRKGFVKVEYPVTLDEKWGVVARGRAWGRVRLDVLHADGDLHVIDWKTGGIDKSKKTIRHSERYETQLHIYGIAALIAQPKFDEARGTLAFLDAPAGVSPLYTVASANVKRGALEKHKKWLEGRLRPMLSDTVFAPRPGFYCGWDRDGQRQGCPFEKVKGGPCPY